MTVKEFLKVSVNTLELIAIRECGKVISVVWIDPYDLFTIHPDIENKNVISDSWEEITVTDKQSRITRMPCRVVDVK